MKLQFISVSDENLFTKNSQNDLVYAPVATKSCDISASCLLCTDPTFSKFIRSLLWCQNLPTSFSLIRVLNSPRSAADAGAPASDLQHCCRCVYLPARWCTNRSCSWHGQASLPQDTPFLSHDMWPANMFLFCSDNRSHCHHYNLWFDNHFSGEPGLASFPVVFHLLQMWTYGISGICIRRF